MKIKISDIVCSKDTRWLSVWTGGSLLLLVWDVFFLNRPALQKVITGFVNTFIIASMVVAFTLVLGWLFTLLLHSLASRRSRALYLLVTFILNLIRSVPQIVGILFAYVGITFLVEGSVVSSKPLIMVFMAIVAATIPSRAN